MNQQLTGQELYDTAGVHANKANEYYENKQYDAAIKEFSIAIDLLKQIQNPNDDVKEGLGLCYNNRGGAYNNKSDYNKAMIDCNEAMKLKSDNPTYYNNRGYAYNGKGDYDSAINDYNEAIVLKSDDHIYYGNRGHAYYGKGDYDSAINDYSEAIKLYKAPIYYNDRGDAYYCKGDYDKAIEDYDEAIELDEDNPVYHSNRGGAYRRKGDCSKIIKKYDEAIENYNEAIKNYDKAIKINKHYYTAYVGKGLTHQLVNECNIAQNIYNELFAVITDNANDNESTKNNESESDYTIECFKHIHKKYECEQSNDKKDFLKIIFNIILFSQARGLNITKYTTKNTFDKIYKKKKENDVEVNAFSRFTINIASSMNDANEGKVLFHYLHDSTDCKDFYNTKHSVFISSFTENPGDAIGMWNSQYGDVCKGISFTFSTSTTSIQSNAGASFNTHKKAKGTNEIAISNQSENKKSSLNYYRVIYYNKDNSGCLFNIFEYDKKENIVKKQEQLSKKISELFIELQDGFDKLNKHEANKEFLQASLLMLSHLIKDISYYHENEVRLLNIIFNDNSNDKQARSKVKRYDGSSIVHFETDHIIRPHKVTLSPYLTKDSINRDNYRYVFDYNVEVVESVHPFNVGEQNSNTITLTAAKTV